MDLSKKLVAFLLMGVCSVSFAITTTSQQVKRQGAAGVESPAFVRGLPRDLVPPPALSASFPTLRPQTPFGRTPIKNSNKNGPASNTHVPPFTLPGANPAPLAESSKPKDKEEIKLLPPIEIPPERPLTDAEIARLSFKETSFVPTTGQGIVSKDNAQVQLVQAIATQPTIPTIESTVNNNKTTVKFPEGHLRPNILPKNCPVCECTSEVDYICASNGALYLNSCSFDCATFCEEGLTKVPLELCSSSNHL